jgi:hypothetical protein
VCQADVFTTGAGEPTLIATMLSTVIVRPIERRLGSWPARPW